MAELWRRRVRCLRTGPSSQGPREKHEPLVPVLLRGGWTRRGQRAQGVERSWGARGALFPSPKFHVTRVPFPALRRRTSSRGCRAVPGRAWAPDRGPWSGGRSSGSRLSSRRTAPRRSRLTRAAPREGGRGSGWGSPAGSSTDRTAAGTASGVHCRPHASPPGPFSLCAGICTGCSRPPARPVP